MIRLTSFMRGSMSIDREKKIAEIRKSAEEARKTDRSWVDGQDYADDVEFLLDELERERVAHNAHVAELLEKEAEVEKIQELAVKITKEREKERAKLNQAVEALEKIKKYYGEEGYYGYSVANQAIKSIKGGESDE